MNARIKEIIYTYNLLSHALHTYTKLYLHQKELLNKIKSNSKLLN